MGSETDWAGDTALIVIGVVCVLMVLAFYQGRDRERDRAVEAGAAEYYINEGHKKDFRYLPVPDHTPSEDEA